MEQCTPVMKQSCFITRPYVSPYVQRYPCAPQDILTELPLEGTASGGKHWASVSGRTVYPLHLQPSLINPPHCLWQVAILNLCQPTEWLRSHFPTKSPGCPWVHPNVPGYQASCLHCTSEMDPKVLRQVRGFPRHRNQAFLCLGAEDPEKNLDSNRKLMFLKLRLCICLYIGPLYFLLSYSKMDFEDIN